MTIPFYLHIYILPGLLDLLCLLIFLQFNPRRALKITKEYAWISLPIILLSGYLLGFLVQTIITNILYPAWQFILFFFQPTSQEMNNSHGIDPTMIAEMDDVYSKMIMLRGLWISMFYLSVKLIQYTYKLQIHWIKKTFVITLIILSFFSVLIAWCTTRNNFQDVKQKAFSNNSQTK